MRTVRSLCAIVLTPTLVLAIIAGTLMPPEHIHPAGIEGRTHSIVHRHAIQGSGSGPLGHSIENHGSHDRALFLSACYDSVSRFVTHAPAILETAISIVPLLGPLESVHADDARRAHGPPGPTSPGRAPPSHS